MEIEGDPMDAQGQPRGSGEAAAWSTETIESHVTILGALYIAFSLLGILLALCAAAALIVGGWVSGDAEVKRITDTLAFCVGAFFLALSLPGILGGIFLLQRHNWARILVLVLGFLNLLLLPVGTILGVYTIWVLLKPEADVVFR